MNRFENEIAKSFRSCKRDNLPLGLNCPYEYIRLVVNKQATYGIQAPCDALVDTYQGVSLALELKEQQKREGFKLSRVPDHQIEGLKRFSLIGRKSFLLICFRHWQLPEKEMLGMKPLQKREAQKRRAYALDIDTFIAMKAEAESLGAASIPALTIDSRAIRLNDTYTEYENTLGKKVKIPTWDISNLQ